ncbi:TPA: hypothetical protein ACK1SE_001090, partial [Proteus mirabilis]
TNIDIKTTYDREFFLFTYGDDDYIDDIKPTILNRESLKTSDISKLIIENRMNSEKFREYMLHENKLDKIIFILSENINNDIFHKNQMLSPENMYKECKNYITTETKKRIANRKDELLIRVRKKIICEMNKTSLITESEEKFVLDKDNKIVFEDKNS